MKRWGYQREVIRARPQLAFWILTIGAGVHFAACLPLFGRRGFPEYPPFFLAMQWLWVFSISISAIWIPLTRKRLLHLSGYMLVTGFTISWTIIWGRPSYKTPIEALIELPILLPFYLPAIVFVELASRAVLRALRRFLETSECKQCGYPLHHLSHPECPECGQKFDEQLLSISPVDIQPTLRPWRTRIFATFVIIDMLAFPPLYHLWCYRQQYLGGREWAEIQWRDSEAVWYVTDAELASMTPTQQNRFDDLYINFETDPASGLLIKSISNDWWRVHWQTAYRQRIEELLKEAGKSPPDFGT